MPLVFCHSHANCPIGEKCRNRRMQQLKSSLPRTEVFAEFERGLGVRAIDLIPKVGFFPPNFYTYIVVHSPTVFLIVTPHFRDPRILSYLNMWVR